MTIEGFKYPKPELVDQSTESERNISCSGYFLFFQLQTYNNDHK